MKKHKLKVTSKEATALFAACSMALQALGQEGMPRGEKEIELAILLDSAAKKLFELQVEANEA